MADIAALYAGARKELADVVAALPEKDLERPVPATPAWSIRDVVAHLAGVARCAADGDFPHEFFMAVGSQQGIAALNEWTDRHVGDRTDRPVQELLDEWEDAAGAIAPMMRGDVAWPDTIMSFAGHILLTDVGVHQQDVYGALGVDRGRDGAPVRIGFSTYAAGADLRIRSAGGPPLRFVTERKEVVAGDGEPLATVRAPSFELFRALSGRRSPDQIRGYEWDGDPEPYLEVFYPYGVREEALAE